MHIIPNMIEDITDVHSEIDILDNHLGKTKDASSVVSTLLCDKNMP